MTELEYIKWDIIGICETRSSSEFCSTWKENGHEVHIGAGFGQHLVGGVGFIINKKIAKQVIEVKICSSRIATLKIDIGKKQPLLIVQIYAPHSGYDEDEISMFYEEAELQLEQQACQKSS